MGNHLSTVTIGENRQLVTDEPVEFENNRLKFKIVRKVTDRYKGICEIYPILIKENRSM